MDVIFVDRKERYRNKSVSSGKRQKAMFLSEKACLVLEEYQGVDGMSQADVCSYLLERCGEILKYRNPVVWSQIVSEIQKHLV
ncbi:MAG: hypothetical protein H7833_08515 [Magnetococcus sp. DMHC-1]